MTPVFSSGKSMGVFIVPTRWMPARARDEAISKTDNSEKISQGSYIRHHYQEKGYMKMGSIKDPVSYPYKNIEDMDGKLHERTGIDQNLHNYNQYITQWVIQVQTVWYVSH